MNKTIEELKAEIIKEKEILEARAFKIYCLEELERQMDIVTAAKSTWDNTVKRLNSLTIEQLTKDFNSNRTIGFKSPKESIIEKLKEV